MKLLLAFLLFEINRFSSYSLSPHGKFSSPLLILQVLQFAKAISELWKPDWKDVLVKVTPSPNTSLVDPHCSCSAFTCPYTY